MSSALHRFMIKWEFIPLKSLDENELIIKWGDELIKGATHLGHISRDSFMLDWVFTEAPKTQEEADKLQSDPARKVRNEVLRRLGDVKGKLDIINKELADYLTGVKNHLLSHRYIEDPSATDSFWKLTDKGWLVKELGGHFRYKKYRKREIAVLEHQNIINWLLFCTALASVICPFVIAIWLAPDTNVTVKSEPKIEMNMDNERLRSVVNEILKERSHAKTNKIRKNQITYTSTSIVFIKQDKKHTRGTYSQHGVCRQFGQTEVFGHLFFIVL